MIIIIIIIIIIMVSVDTGLLIGKQIYKRTLNLSRCKDKHYTKHGLGKIYLPRVSHINVCYSETY
jgi:hypothetical protein